mgnify:CR=1 FL=1
MAREITDRQIMEVIHDRKKSRKDREREAVEMVRQQQREAREGGQTDEGTSKLRGRGR